MKSTQGTKQSRRGQTDGIPVRVFNIATKEVIAKCNSYLEAADLLGTTFTVVKYAHRVKKRIESKKLGITVCIRGL